MTKSDRMDPPQVVRLFWPEHLRHIPQPHWLLGWAELSQAQTLGRRQRLLSLIVVGSVPQADGVSSLGDLRPAVTESYRALPETSVRELHGLPSVRMHYRVYFND